MSNSGEVSFADRLHASAVKFLFDGGEHELAAGLLSCYIEVRLGTETKPDYFGKRACAIGIACGRAFYDLYHHYEEEQGSFNSYYPYRDRIEEVLTDIVGRDTYYLKVELRIELLEIDTPNWKEKIEDILRGEKSANQGTRTEKSKYRQYWNNLHFGSKTEVKIAQELDSRGILYFPGCIARTGEAEARKNLEPDFLIFHEGKWGILEISGDLYHTPQNAPKDHERVREFSKQGIRVEHYDAGECWENPDKVIDEFLQILKRL